MTSTTLDTAIEQTAIQARQVRFTRVVITLIAGIFYAVGWIFGHLWLGVVFAALMVRQGWREGSGWQPPVPEAEPSR